MIIFIWLLLLFFKYMYYCRAKLYTLCSTIIRIGSFNIPFSFYSCDYYPGGGSLRNVISRALFNVYVYHSALFSTFSKSLPISKLHYIPTKNLLRLPFISLICLVFVLYNLAKSSFYCVPKTKMPTNAGWKKVIDTHLIIQSAHVMQNQVSANEKLLHNWQ